MMCPSRDTHPTPTNMPCICAKKRDGYSVSMAFRSPDQPPQKSRRRIFVVHEGDNNRSLRLKLYARAHPRDVHQYKSVKKRRLGQLFDTNRIFCDESKAGCTYGRGGEEINDNTRHDYVSLELNTLRVREKNGNRGQLYTSIRRCPPPFCPLYLLLLLTRLSLSLSSQRSIYCAVVNERERGGGCRLQM